MEARYEVGFADLIASATLLSLRLTNPKVSELSGIIGVQICPEVAPCPPPEPAPERRSCLN